MAEIEERLEVAREVARRAGALALQYFRDRGGLEIERKGRQDLVSRADREVEDLIRAELGRAFPHDAFLGEEGGGEEAASLWVIDPIDGTMNFLKGIPYWGILLAWTRDRETRIGITHDPVHDETWWAVAERGAWRNGEPIRVSGRSDPGEALMALSFNFKFPPETYTEMLQRSLAHGIDHRRIGSSALKLAYVADGRFDAFVSYETNSWDVLPGLLLVSEAGGRATDFTAGHHPLTRPRSVIAATPGLVPVLEEVSGLRLT